MREGEGRKLSNSIISFNAKTISTVEPLKLFKCIFIMVLFLFLLIQKYRNGNANKFRYKIELYKIESENIYEHTIFFSACQHLTSNLEQMIKFIENNVNHTQQQQQRRLFIAYVC